MTTDHIVETYKGYDIILIESLRFTARLCDEDTITADTANEIREAVDTRIKAEAKSIRLNIPVLTGKGDRATVTGIHMGTSQMIGKGLDKSGHTTHVYPVAPWVQDAIAERERLRSELGAAEERLDSIAISLSRGYGRMDAEEVRPKIADFHDEYNAAYDKAHETTEQG